ncbi:caspase family protein [uncultured Amaricoccus sp.]|uniref:caspase family protein n=1 Tax=uncultured Amaricoccus sp. TaxID=339341 RepID=UPI0026239D77|nr:caspase family protein [uncultured Amaricoccus sp.]
MRASVRGAPIWLVTVALFALAGAAGAVDPPASGMEAPRRVALVIGNGEYGDLGALPNPPNDAADVAKALEALRFEVISVVDGDIDRLHAALRKFGRSAVNAQIALFYYAGHGIALNGENYLIPVGANIEIEPDLPYEALSLSEVQRQLEFSQAPLKMVILDACRNNPLTRSLRRNAAELGRSLESSEGLARMEVAPASGLLIAYATAPGSVALDGRDQRNSPFTAALLNQIATPKIDARVMFSRVRAEVVKQTSAFQTPYVEDGMLGEFEFNPVATEPEPARPPEDIVAWQAISASDDPASFEEFLATYPDSSVVSAAQGRLSQLRDPGGEAKAWEALAGEKDAGPYEIFLRRYPSGVYAPVASFTLQRLLWDQAEAARDAAGMEAYLARFPDGAYADLARRSAEAWRGQDVATAPEAVMRSAEPEAAPPPVAVTTGATPVTLNLSPAAADSPKGGLADPLKTPPHLVQYALSALGYYRGAADGKFGPASREAARRYQRALGGPADGVLTGAQVVSLLAAGAEAGDANSQVAYGMLLARGAGLPRDDAAAADWFRKAADAGNGPGQYNLGLLYLGGRGVAADESLARALLGQAAENGVPAARTKLAEIAE